MGKMIEVDVDVLRALHQRIMNVEHEVEHLLCSIPGYSRYERDIPCVAHVISRGDHDYSLIEGEETEQSGNGQQVSSAP